MDGWMEIAQAAGRGLHAKYHELTGLDLVSVDEGHFVPLHKRPIPAPQEGHGTRRRYLQELVSADEERAGFVHGRGGRGGRFLDKGTRDLPHHFHRGALLEGHHHRGDEEEEEERQAGHGFAAVEGVGVA